MKLAMAIAALAVVISLAIMAACFPSKQPTAADVKPPTMNVTELTEQVYRLRELELENAHKIAWMCGFISAKYYLSAPITCGANK